MTTNHDVRSVDDGVTDALVAVVPRTGQPAVDAAGARLAELATVDVRDHPAIFESVHEQLAAALNDAMNRESGPGEA